MDDLSISRQLDAYLRSLTSGADFQRFACKFVTYNIPEIFPPDKTNFYSGANPTGQVTKGHPDASAEYLDGMAAIEVCSTKTPRQAIKDIKEDMYGLKKQVTINQKKVTFLCVVLGLLSDRMTNKEVENEIKANAKSILGLEGENVRVIPK